MNKKSKGNTWETTPKVKGHGPVKKLPLNNNDRYIGNDNNNNGDNNNTQKEEEYDENFSLNRGKRSMKGWAWDELSGRTQRRGYCFT